MMKRLTALSVALLSVWQVLSAQVSDVYAAFVGNISDARLCFSYSFTGGFETKVTGKGEATVQDDCFLLDGNGLRIYCDGKTASTLDPAAKEVIIESLEEDSGNYINPAQLLGTVDKVFRCKSQTPVSYAGHNAVKVILEPRRNPSEVSRITLYLSRDGKAAYGLSMSESDGSSTDFFIPSFKILPRGPVSDFRLDTSSLGSGYIITDLR